MGALFITLAASVIILIMAIMIFRYRNKVQKERVDEYNRKWKKDINHVYGGSSKPSLSKSSSSKKSKSSATSTPDIMGDVLLYSALTDFPDTNVNVPLEDNFEGFGGGGSFGGGGASGSWPDDSSSSSDWGSSSDSGSSTSSGSDWSSNSSSSSSSDWSSSSSSSSDSGSSFDFSDFSFGD